MPGSTTVFGISYPCEGDLVTVSAMNNYANSVEAALSSVWTTATTALQPPAASVLNVAGQTVNTGVTAVLSYTTVKYDRGGFFNIASPTLLTVPANGAGNYFIAMSSSGNISGNVTSVRWAFLRNGTEVAYWEGQNTGALSAPSTKPLHVMLPGLVPGDQITHSVLYTGTQPSLQFFGRLNVTRLSIP